MSTMVIVWGGKYPGGKCLTFVYRPAVTQRPENERGERDVLVANARSLIAVSTAELSANRHYRATRISYS